MTGSDDPSTEDAFEVLSSELRLAILDELASADAAGDPVCSFSTLYDRVDADNTPSFSYHLSRLAPHFVSKTEAGYRLTPAGDRVVRAARASAYESNPTFEPTTVDGHCPNCGWKTLEATLEGALVVLSCADCGTGIVRFDLPPGQASGAGSDAVLHACDRRVRHEYEMALDGICNSCGGEMTLDIEAVEEDCGTHDMALSQCATCDLQVFAPVELRLLYHPAVLALYWRHGVDATEIPLWELLGHTDAWEKTVTDRDPFAAEIRVRVPDEAESLLVGLDAALGVEILDERSPDAAQPRHSSQLDD
ncbi:winged helix-turn-helix domain-containing protein [Haloarchaeobius amylolyticus]|uniref:winged helix-turn-helix domain-containing protein n=1 Tax=Haloarchaeobius amylolyticus TaxID=1198296 RepID=UPI00226D423C|nr:helix-turn-helix domain-containing protein [Haloarchaeobius amylolyticus]